MDDAHRVVRGLAGVLRTHYPNFALGLPLRPDEIPVFIYHDVTPDGLAEDLDFLRRNGYETLGLEEFLRLTTELPEWAGGFPLKAEGGSGVRYAKG